MRLVLAISLCLGLAAGCGKKDEKAGGGDKAEKAGEGGGAAASGKSYSCTKTKMGKCTEYSGEATVLGETALKGGCDALEATFAEGTCPRDNSLGTCDMGKGQVTVYYPTEGDMGNTPDSAKSDCETIYEGKWAAGAAGAAPAPAGGAAPAEGAAPAGGAAPTTP
ncbi:MAG TPA: hypothetical protein VMZ28_09735 [Kofleriaceae bacterium]|nr:hypothetical protein [Kofleriaceae bacterium]